MSEDKAVTFSTPEMMEEMGEEEMEEVLQEVEADQGMYQESEEEDETLAELMSYASGVSSKSQVPRADQLDVPKQPPPTPQPIVVQLPEPSRTQVAAQTAAAIAKEEAKRASARMRKSNLEAHKAASEFKKMADTSPEIIKEKVKLCMQCQKYKEAYQGRINWEFKKTYSATKMSLDELRAEIEGIEAALNSEPGAFIIYSLMKVASNFCEYLSIRYGKGTLSSFAQNVEVSIANGYFQDEVQQLSIKYSDWLQVGPEWRLGGKMLHVGTETYRQNSSGNFFFGGRADGKPNNVPDPKKTPPSKLDAEFLERYSDI